jgi:glycine reductase complex component B subunit gamma
MVTIVHVLNQFFAGFGGEEKAGMGVDVTEGAAGAARGLQLQLAGQGNVVSTIYYGDNYFHEHKEEALKAILDILRPLGAQVVVAGPAFNSGRYGVSCVEACNAIGRELAIPCVTAMHAENPGIGTYRDVANPLVYCLNSAETTAGMPAALKALASFAVRLASGDRIGPAENEGYIPRGIRRLEKTDRAGVERAIDMLLKKMHHEPFVTEIPMEVWEDVPPAPALKNVSEHNIAVVTTSGVVPWGNPDRFKTYRNTHWQKYNIAELKELEPGKWEAVHGGYNIAYMNKNPHYGVPLDALRSLEAEGRIGPGRLYPAYFVIPGNQGSPAVMRRVGQEIGADLKNDGVEGVLFVAT